MYFLKQIQELESEAFRKPLSQIVIDMVQDVEFKLNRDESDNPIERDELGSIIYDIHILLVVFNPSFSYDIDVLNRLCNILMKWRDEVEFVNRILGIPLHRG